MSVNSVIRIMTYNFYCRPRQVFSDNQVNRAKSIGKTISDYEKTKGYRIDTMIFQEIVDNKAHKILKKEMNKIGFIYKSKRLDSSLKLNGGLIIYSRFPIVEEDKLVFKNSSPYLSMVTKGIVFTKIMIYNKIINLVNLHLDSFSPEIRHDQMKTIKKFLDDKDIPDTEYIFIGGDYNIDMNDSEFDNVTSSFEGYNVAESLEEEYTLDAEKNNLVERRDFNNTDRKYFIDYFVYKGKDFKKKNITHEVVVKEEEYTAEEYMELSNIEVSMKVVKFQKQQKLRRILYGTPFYLNIYSMFKKYNVNDLSDHYAVLTEFAI
jgi:endonuclease/exonuclease/phosphatase family metal-dependent hydrolase